jgi:hypothetical protein
VGRTLLAAGRWDDARRWASCCGDATAGHDATLAQAAALVAEWRAAEEAMEGATERWDEEGVEGELEEVGEELWESVSQLFVDEAVPAERAGGFLAAAAVVTGRANRSRRDGSVELSGEAGLRGHWKIWRRWRGECGFCLCALARMMTQTVTVRRRTRRWACCWSAATWRRRALWRWAQGGRRR